MGSRRPKQSPIPVTLPSIIRSGRALFVVALLSTPIGALAGLCAGMFFYGSGALYGAPLGVPLGFLAALFGAAIGRRTAWTVSGAIAGALGGLVFLNLMQDAILFCSGFLPVGLLVPAIASGLAGWLVGDKIDNAYVTPRGLIGVIDRQLYNSPLYGLSLPVRLSIAAVEAAPLLALFLLWQAR